MNYLKSYRSKRSVVPSFSALLVLGIIGCDGGMIGTGSGPANSVYELEHLPNRISPDIPDTLKNDDALPPSEETKESDISPRMTEDEPQESGGWYKLASELTQVAVTRFEIELNTAIIDLAFDEIVQECEEKLVDCTIPAGQIRVTVTQELVNRWLDDYVAKAQSITISFGADVVAASIKGTIEEINSMLDNEVVLGETHYSQLDGAPYDHVVRTSVSNSDDKVEGDYPLFRADEIITAHWEWVFCLNFG